MIRRSANLINIAHRLFDTPVAIHPAKYEILIAALGPRLGIDPNLIPGLMNAEYDPAYELSAEQIAKLKGTLKGKLKGTFALDEDDLDYGDNDGQDRSNRKPYGVSSDGIAVIRVCGTLVKKSSWMQALSGMTSYQSLDQQISECMADDSIRAILLNCNSPGGETHGLFDLCDKIHGFRGKKPIHAIANDAALSAAYAIASCADKGSLYVTRTGAVGSVGVFAGHIDQSAADQQAGLKFTYIHAGKKKVDGNPHEPLSKSARADAQAEVDREYQMFCSLVARNRKLQVSSVEDTEAGVYFAELGVASGLADKVGTLDDCYQSVLEKSGISSSAKLKTYPADRVLGKAASAQVSAADLGPMSKIGAPITVNLQLVKQAISAMSPAEAKRLHAELSNLASQGDPAMKIEMSDELLKMLGKKADDADDADEGKHAEDADEGKKGKKAEDADEGKKGKKADEGKKAGDADDMKDCPDCDGTGKDDDGEACETCHGSGEIKKSSKKGKKAESADEGRKGEDAEEGKKKGSTIATMPRADAIIQLCQFAGMPDAFAVKAVSKGYSVSQVRDLILEHRNKADRSTGEINSNNGEIEIAALDKMTVGIARVASKFKVGQANGVELHAKHGMDPQVVRGMRTAEATYEVLMSNPQVYQQYLDEREDGNANRRARLAYSSALGQRLRGEMLGTKDPMAGY